MEGCKKIRVLVVGPGLDVRLFVVWLEAVGLPGRHFGVGSFDRRGSEEFLFADCGYEFLEVEWFEVGDVFKAALAVGAEGRLEHC